MVQQHVVLADRGEEVGRVAQPVGHAGHERAVFEAGDGHGIDQRRHPGEVDRTVDAIRDRRRCSSNWLQQELRELGGTARRDLEPHRLAEMALRQLALQRLPQVLHFFLVEPEVRVARHAELRVADDLAPAEQLVQVRVDDARQQDERVVGAGDRARQRDDARQQPRRLDRGDRGLASEGVATGQLDDEIEALVGHLRKRMRRIEADRRQQRLHFALEIVGHPCALLGIEVVAPQQADARVQTAPGGSPRSAAGTARRPACASRR